MLVYSFNKNGSGSYLDSVSGTKGVNTSGLWKKTEKGYAWLGNGVDTKVTLAQTLSLGTVFSFTCAIRVTDNTIARASLAKGIVNFSSPILLTPSSQIIYVHDGTNNVFENRPELFDGNWHIVTVTKNGTSVYFYVDGIIGAEKTLASDISISIDQLFNRSDGSYFKGYCNYIEIDNTILSQKQINNLYKDFLRNKGTGSSIYKNDFPIKADDLSNKNGLVAAYNMIPSRGGVLVDTSGNGNNGTINGAISTKNGMAFDAVKSYIELNSIINQTIGSYSCRITPKDFSNSGHLLGNINATISYIRFDTDGKIRIESTTNGDTDVFDYVFDVDKEYTITVTVDSNNLFVLYVNGILEDSFTLVSNALGIMYIGAIALGTTRQLGAIIEDILIWSKVLSLQEIKNYHNQFVKPTIIEDFQNKPVGEFPREWIKGTGTYIVSESVDGNKYLENTVAGTAAIQSKIAYGEWKFDIYKEAAGNAIQVFFMQGVNDDSTSQGYNIFITNLEAIRLQIKGVSNLFTTANDYITIKTWYRIKVTNTEAGVKTTYIKGGAFGDNYVLVDPTGGTGTNPVTDNTYTTSKYFVTDLDAGDRIDNIIIKK